MNTDLRIKYEIFYVGGHPEEEEAGSPVVNGDEFEDGTEVEEAFNPWAGFGARRLSTSTSHVVVGDANIAWSEAAPSITSVSDFSEVGWQFKVVYASFIINILAALALGGSTVTIVSRYIGSRMGCPCGLARKIKFSDLLK